MPFPIELALENNGYIMDIGQLDAEVKCILNREVRTGRLEKSKGRFAGVLAMKTVYIRDREMFEQRQRADAAHMHLAAILDNANRS